ncbi:hypothetical protein [Streptomyces sp. NPDC048603]|uniref:hypothetical protein n=1 Tax=Streptomyces sp. NPDC048603 TaxID=3365577 RepID=UPI00371AD1A5
MITEPELEETGEPASGPYAAPDASSDVVEPAAPRERRSRRGLLWALGGAVAASVVWAGGLYAYGDRAAAPEQAYRLPEKLCEEFRPTALGKAVPGLSDGRGTRSEEGRGTLEWGVCALAGKSEKTPSGEWLLYTIELVVERHTEIDPAVEFGLGVPAGNVGQTSTVSGLGEKAFFTDAGAGRQPVLRVVDHEAVFTLRMDASSMTGDGAHSLEVVTDNVDYEAVKYAMIEDVRKLMDTLREK